ncbi:MAG: class I SAM-dependent methyltransferase [Candidatus Sumerlaeota bacterium]
MDHREAGAYWNENAEVWTRLARQGYDVYRDRLNAPAFMEMLPDVEGLSGIDLGCGEGYNTRLMARAGAKMTAVDISEVFIRHASEQEASEPLGIDYQVASAVETAFADEHFDFTAATMSLMDIPEPQKALAEAFRIVKPGGFLQFSITHPCYDTPYRRNLRDESGKTYALEVGDYFGNLKGEIVEWIFGATPPEIRKTLPKFKTPFYTFTLSEWLNMIIGVGFQIEELREPRPSDETVAQCPELQDAQVVAYFLHVRGRRP